MTREARITTMAAHVTLLSDRRDNQRIDHLDADCGRTKLAAVSTRKRTPRGVNGMRAGMIRTLKMSTDRTALRGIANLVTFNVARPGRATMDIAGMTAKLFATSLAMEKTVRARRVINICLPMARRSVSLVGSCLARRIEVGCEQRGLNQFVLLRARYRTEIIRLAIAGGDRFGVIEDDRGADR